MPEQLQNVIARVIAGSRDLVDLQAIASAIQNGQINWASGQGAVAVGRDAVDSLIVSGSNNFIGNTFVIPEAAAATIQALLTQQSRSAQTPAISLNELLQQVRSRASAKVLNLFSKIQLLNKRQIEVDRLYVDIYVLEMHGFRATIPGLLKGQDVREQFDRLGLGKREARLQGLAIAASEDYPRLMVLGKPGSGKSTFLRHLAVSCAKGEFLGDYISVLLELRDVNEATFSLFQCIHQEFELEQEAQTEQILKRGQVLILLDGLDEVPSPLRQTVQNELRKFAKRYDKNRFILTCRTQTTEYIPEQFQAIEVADFKPEQVECFALNWFTAMAGTPEQGAVLKDHFMEKLRESPQTAELAVTPVLLSLTCWIFDDLQCLPQKRSDLYRDGLDLLLQQWDEGRGISRDSGCDRYQQLSTEQRKQLLSYLAVRKFEQPENFVLFEESELCGYIAEHLQTSIEESRSVLRAIVQQHGLLIKRAQGIWSFSHLTFQEYLVAKWFCDREDWQELVRCVADFYWSEVCLLATEMSSNTDQCFLAIKSAIDRLSISHLELSEFLTWVSQKASTVLSEVDISYTETMIRAFYLEKCLLFVLKRQGLMRRAGCRDLYLRNTMTLDSTLIHYFLSASSWIGGREFVGGEIEGSANDFAKVFDINACNNAREDELKASLEELRDRLPIFDKNLDNYFTWWAQNGSVWLANLGKAVEYRNLQLINGKQLTDEQKQVFRHYHVINWILLECLKNTSSVSYTVKAEIEEALLLPITEIEKRKKQSSD